MKRLAAAALICLPTTASADLSADLAQTFQDVAHVEDVADLLNCVALNRSLSLVFGPDSEFYEGFRTREGYLASVAGILWVEAEEMADQDSDRVFDILLPPINMATDHYLARMDALTLETDTPFDDQILDQVDFCNAMYVALRDAAGDTRIDPIRD